MTDLLPGLLAEREIDAAIEAFINSPFKIHPRLPISDDPFLKDRMRAALDAAIASARQSGERQNDRKSLVSEDVEDFHNGTKQPRCD